MDPILKKDDTKILSKLRTWSTEYQTKILGLSICFMSIISFLRWKYELNRLLLDTSHYGAIDLGQRFFEVSQWFDGNPVYGKINTATYPPASYIILWPFLGWLKFTPARWFWAFIMMAALTWIIIIVVRESLAESLLERLFLILLILSMYSTCITVGNGQLGIHILPLLLCGLLMTQRSPKTWLMDISISLMILFCMVKPSITLPFLWIFLFQRKIIRPATMIAVMYICFTLFAISFQDAGFFVLMKNWLLASKHAALNAKYGYANIHQWMNSLGLGDWIPYASLSVFILLGFWLYYYRNGDLWLLMGVTAIIARFWTYHAPYDDILILIPMVAVFRITKLTASTREVEVRAGILIFFIWFSMIVPASILIYPPPWNFMFKTGQTLVWLSIMIFLLKNINLVPKRN